MQMRGRSRIGGARAVATAFTLVAIAAGAGTAACTVLAQFDDKDGGFDGGDDVVDIGPDEAGEIDASDDLGPGIVVTPDAGGDDASDDVAVDAAFDCTGKADGTSWSPGDDTARCCGGVAVHTTTNANCGACGIACKTASGQACGALVGHYYCLGCERDGSTGAQDNSSCWSGCCSVSFYAKGACAASNCGTGDCNQAVCPTGTTCKTPGTSSNYCGY